MIDQKTALPYEAMNNLFNDVSYLCHKSHMMALALEQVFENVVPNSQMEGTPRGYVLVTIEHQELLSFLVSEGETCARLAKESYYELESSSQWWRFPNRERPAGSENNG